MDDASQRVVTKVCPCTPGTPRIVWRQNIITVYILTEEVAYNSYYVAADYPVTRILRDPVFVEVQLMDRNDANLVLNLGRCWTTTSANPHSLPQWDILIDG